MNKHYSISKQELIVAHNRISPFVHRTPILTSTAINQQADCQIFFKCENFQKVGAFKMRGATNAILQLSDKEKKQGVVAHSSGNHAQAVALAAKLVGIKAYLVMPSNAPKVKVAAVEEYGGEVIFCEPNLAAREKGVEKVIDQKGATLIHPFNNKAVISGQATVAKELIEEQQELDAIFCPVGGGGLLAGTILSAHYFSPYTKVYAGEPKQADDAYLSLQKGELIQQVAKPSIADGLLTSLGTLNYDIIVQGVSDIFVVSESEIIDAMQLIWERMKIVVEPSCAVPLAGLLQNKQAFKGQKIGIILSGGNVDLTPMFDFYKKRIN